MGATVWTETAGDLEDADSSDNLAEDPTVDVGASRRLSLNLTALGSGQMVTWTMTLLWTLVVPRLIGPDGLGMIVSALSVAGILGIALGLGTRNYLVREMVVNPDSAPQLVGTALVLRLFLVPAFAVAVALYARLAHIAHEETIVLYLAAATTVLMLLAEPIQAGFQAMERMKYLAYSDVINKSCQSLIGIGLAVAGFRAVGLTANMAVVALLLVWINLIWLRRFFRISFHTSFRMIKTMTKESTAYWAYGIFGTFYLWIDTVMLSLFTNSRTVGWYGASVNLFQTLMFVPVLLSTAWLPRLVTAFERGMPELHKTARAPFELVLILSAPICAGTAMAAGPIIHTLYGRAFAPATSVLVILALCIPFIYLNIIQAQVLLAAKRQAWWTYAMLGSSIFNPLLNLLLIPETAHRYGNGAIGASISLLVTEAAMVITGFFMVGRNVFGGDTLRRPLLAAAASLGMWGTAYAARPLGPAPSIAIGLGTLVALALATRLVRPADLRGVWSLMRGAFAERRRPVVEALPS